MVRLAVDAMSGDEGPLATLPAAVSALESHSDLEIVLVGQAEGIKAALGQMHPRLFIDDTPDVVRMDELPTHALRHGKNTSMWRAIELVASGQAAACVSAGNTGALMAMSRHLLKTLPGIDRPAICASLPTSSGSTYMLDLGANVSASSEQLLQFALMGAAMVETLDGKNLPTVGLLNIGSESTKGHDTLHQAARLIRDNGLNYSGFVEGTDLYTGNTDVIVTDGFTGNVALKASEGMAQFVIQRFKDSFKHSWRTKLAGLLAMPELKHSMKNIDPRHYNGASLLGLRGLVVKSHGNADYYAFNRALMLARREASRSLCSRLESALEPLIDQEGSD
ncbi:fatty acid/phospholipid synthesis protein PlsX [gamma proteobacterium HTCC5015]|nr:fatty acid/phospholipid synthesis protein PlsX [gamma proteobacterium HTCC5015]